VAEAVSQRRLIDLGTVGGDRLRNVFSPTYDEAGIRRYVHEQFIERAAAYAESFTDGKYSTWFLNIALKKIGWYERQITGSWILDVGSAAGNSVIPLLKLCSDARVIATDLSVELLVILRRVLERQGLEDRCALLQLNAEELEFRQDCFDLVVGAAILHHLISPDLTVRGCARILKPGGHAMFFKPFENGNAILNLICREILRDS